MATLASLAINLIAQTNRFTRPLAEASRTVDQFANKVQSSLSRIEQVSKRAGLALAAIKAPVIAATKLAADYAGNIDTISQATGLAIESVQQLSYAASQGGSDLATLTSSLRALARRSAEAYAGHSGFARAYERIGVSVADANGQLKDIETLLMEVADAVSTLNTESEMAAALMNVMGDAGRRMVPFMKQGSAGISELMEEAERLGLVMESRAIRQLAAFSDQTARTQNRIGALSREFAVQFVPALSLVDRVINEGISALMGLDEEAKANIAMIATMTAAVLGLVVGLGMIAAGVSVAAKALGFISVLFGVLTSPITLAIAAIWLFATAWSNNWLGIQEITRTVWDAIGGIFAVITENLSVAWTWTATLAGDAWDWLSGPAWTWVKDTAWPTLTDSLRATWSWIATKSGIAWSWLSGDAWTWVKDTAWPTLTEGISVAWAWTADRIGDAWGWLSGTAWTWVRDKAWPTLTEKVDVAWEWAADRAGEAWGWLSEDAWDWIKDTAWPALTKNTETAWKWAAEKGGDAWDWLSGPAWTWVKDTAWPTLTGSLSVAWAWAAERSGQAWGWLSGDAWEWVRDTGWPTLTQSLSAAWKWAADRTGDAWTWLSGPAWDWVKDTAWPAITTGFSVAWTWVAEKGGAAWDWVTDTLIPWVTGPLWEKLSTGFETAWKWTAALGGDVWQWLKEVAWPHINGVVETTWNWAIEIGGEIYQAIKKGLDTGDWSDLFVVGADVWRAGVKLAVTLSLVYGTASALIKSIQTGLGMAATGLGSLGALGVPGAIGGITIAVALAEAQATSNFQKFGEDLAAALAAGLAIYGITRNPQLGAYTFTIFMSWELGSKTAEWLRGMISTDDVEQFRISDAAAARPLAAWQKELAQINEELRSFVETMGYAVDLMSEAEIADVAFKLGAEDVWKRRQEILGFIQEYNLAEIELAALEGRLLGVEIPQSIRASSRVAESSVSSLEGFLRSMGVAELLDAIYVAEGGAAASVPYGMTGFRDQGYQFAVAANEAFFAGLVEGFDLEPFSDEWYRAAAATTVTHWFGHFRNEFLEGAGVTFAELAPEMQALFVQYLGSKYAPPASHPLNAHWPGNVGRYLGLPGFAEGGWTGDIPPDQIAGFVHGREIVIPEYAHRKGLAGILEFLGVPGYKDGLTQRIPNLDADTATGITGVEGFLNSIAGQMASLVEMMDAGVESLLTLLETTILEAARSVLPEESFAALEDRTLSLTRSVREGWRSFKDLFRSADDLDSTFADLRKTVEDHETALKQQAAIASLQARILARLPVIAAAMDGIAAGAAFGPRGSVVGALIAVAMETEAVGHTFRMLNEILAAGANALGMFLQPLLPLIYVLQAVLVPVLGVLGQVLEYVLLPIMPGVFEGLKLLGVAVLFVAEAFQTARGFILGAVGGLVEGIARFIDSIPFVSAKGMIQAGVDMQRAAKAAFESAEELGDARRDLISLTYEEAMERAKNTEALERATQALMNVPISARILNRLRWESATPRADVGPATVPGLQLSAAGAPAGGGDLIFTGDITIVADDPEEFERQMRQYVRRSNLVATGTTAALRRV